MRMTQIKNIFFKSHLVFYQIDEMALKTLYECFEFNIYFNIIY